jgi:membrane protein implicated in regulation of membrane protease activity
VLAYMAPGLGWEIHAVVFAVLSVVSAVVGRRVYARVLAAPSDQPGLNRRAARQVGNVHTLVTPIVDGSGRVKVGDTTWTVSGPDLPAGARVKVVAADGIVLKVEKAE